MSDTFSSRSGNTLEVLGWSIIPMAVPISSHPRTQDNLTLFKCPDQPCRFKENLVVVTAREYDLMPNYDIRSPKDRDRIAVARDGEFVIFRDSLKGV